MNGNVDASTTSNAALNGNAAHPVANGIATEGPINGTAEPTSNGVAKDSTSEDTTKPSAIEPNANANLHNSTPFVQSLMNGNIDKQHHETDNSADDAVGKTTLKETDVGTSESANGHAIEA